MTLQRKANDNKYLKIFSTSLAIPELQIKSALRVHLLLDTMAITNKREGAERMYTPEGAGKGGKTLSSAHNIALHTSTYDSCYYKRRTPSAEDQVHQNSRMDGEGSLETPILCC